jgi:hypothetical protein
MENLATSRAAEKGKEVVSPRAPPGPEWPPPSPPEDLPAQGSDQGSEDEYMEAMGGMEAIDQDNVLDVNEINVIFNDGVPVAQLMNGL